MQVTKYSRDDVLSLLDELLTFKSFLALVQTKAVICFVLS